MLENYEPVKLRKKRFYDKFPEGRIIVDCVRSDDKCALFKAVLFKNPAEQQSGLPLATGFAYEFSSKGGASKFSWVENAEESSVGRALDNAGFSGNTHCSLEEIVKVKRHEQSEVSSATEFQGNMPTTPTTASMEDFVIDFGKFKGRNTIEIPLHELESYVRYLEKSSLQSGKKMGLSARKLQDYVRSQMMPVSPPTQFSEVNPPPFAEDDVPF
jgi:hypothetical protein